MSDVQKTHKEICWSPSTGWNWKQSQMLCLTAPPWVVILNWHSKCILIEFCHFANCSINIHLAIERKRLDFGLPVLIGLLHLAHSPAQSHYCSTRVLWAAGCLLWPVSHLLRQPGHPGLPQSVHVDAELSADAGSTCHTMQQDSRPQAILKIRPPICLDYSARNRHQPAKWTKMRLYNSVSQMPIRQNDLFFIFTW